MGRIFIAATRQNDGKTMVSLGLFSAFKKRFKDVGYIKPVGQQYKLVDGKKIDKDAVLFKEVYGLDDELRNMSPIAVPKGFTKDYILSDDPPDLAAKISGAFDQLKASNEFVLIEGTGHGGVGSVIDLSNADVASLLGAKVILVAPGGIGSAIDEIMLNKTLFEMMGVTLLGVIINKVFKSKYDEVKPLLERGLKKKGINVFGVIPYVSMLSKPTVATVFDEMKGTLLSGEKGLDHTVEKCVIGDMVPHDALNSLTNDTLLIVPANREGLIMTVLCGNMVDADIVYFVSAIIFTGGHKPHERVLSIIRHTNIPLLLVEEDSYQVASKINQSLVKLRPEEADKMTKIESLIEEYVDVDGICDAL